MAKGFEWNGRVERTCDLRVADEPTGAVAPTLLTKKKNDAVPSHTAQRHHNPNNQIRNQNHVHSQGSGHSHSQNLCHVVFLAGPSIRTFGIAQQ